MDCIFCKIIAKKVPAYIIYEDEHFLAFLDIFPPKLYPGQFLIIPRAHLPSYFAQAGDISSLIKLAQNLAQKTDHVLGSMRTCLVFEGMEIEHLHVKMYPIYKNTYPNYLSTSKGENNQGTRASDEELRMIAQKFLEASK